MWIFPHTGERYHTETCTYVKANAEKMILDSGVKKIAEIPVDFVIPAV